MDFDIILVIIAALLQIGAVILAFKLIEITKTAKGWILISIALVLMAVRRFYHVIDYLQWDLWEYSDIIFKHYLAVIISVSMILGIYFLLDVFREKARIEKKLNETEQFENVLLNSVWTGLWAVDANHNIIYFNKAMEKISGLTSKQVMGTNF
jgi:PAS domain-containing protein